MAYIPALIMSRLVQAKLISLLCITSLIATAYILVFVPNTRLSPPIRAKSKRKLELESRPFHQYIVYLDGALSLVCALNSITFKDRRGVHDGFWLLCLLPIGWWCLSRAMAVRSDKCVVSLTVILFARQLMLSVDVDELEALQYEYKGA